MSRFRSNVLQTFAERYAASTPGRTGKGDRDWLLDFRDLLERADCCDGDARAHAIADLEEAEQSGLLKLDRHRRDEHLIERVRLPLEHEAKLFARMGQKSPTQIRTELAGQFHQATTLLVPESWRAEWVAWCEGLEAAAATGMSVAPFVPTDPDGNHELLNLLPKLLAWQGESLLRFASCVLCGDSKRLGQLSGKLNQCLVKLSQGRIKSLEELALLENPRTILLHGPLVLELNGGILDLGVLRGAYRIAQTDIETAIALVSHARRCVTVENETTFHELVNLRSGDLLVWTSFPGSGTLALLKRLPAEMEFWHFGDTDPEGFEILRDLRERSRRPFQSLHMTPRSSHVGPKLTTQEIRQLQRLIENPAMVAERTELERILAAGHIGAYEQESLGRPNLNVWPYYR